MAACGIPNAVKWPSRFTDADKTRTYRARRVCFMLHAGIHPPHPFRGKDAMDDRAHRHIALTVDLTDVAWAWVWPVWVHARPISPPHVRPEGWGRVRSTPLQRRAWICERFKAGDVADPREVAKAMQRDGLFARSTYIRDVTSGVRETLVSIGVLVGRERA